jgi:8-oxo-dGTP pyrophosphatase MutT (NUDIX family)
MEIVHTGEELPTKIVKSLFLAGPSLRPGQEKEMVSWRKDALDILRDIGYDGVVFVPENRDGKFEKGFSYDNQIEWEEKCLNVADCILFWVPRDLTLDSKGYPKLAAFTTNIEWGTWQNSGKVVFGAPEDAERVDYLKYYADKFNAPIAQTLTETLRNALDKLGDGAERTGGERYVPLFVWQQPSFQSWYQTQKYAGNVLEGAQLLYTFRPGYKNFVFLWALQATIYITSEDRYKKNEIVISRPSTASILLYCEGHDPGHEEIVLIREFRTPASTSDGFIHELPSGSMHGDNPKQTAAEELFEETGFRCDPSRFIDHGERQLSGTFSAHKSHLYSVEITEEELCELASQTDIPHGIEEDSERTFVEIVSIGDLIEDNLVDWTTLGQILSVLRK